VSNGVRGRFDIECGEIFQPERKRHISIEMLSTMVKILVQKIRHVKSLGLHCFINFFAGSLENPLQEFSAGEFLL